MRGAGVMPRNVRDYSWKNGPPKGVDYRDVKIHVVNYKGQYDPFTIADLDGGNVYSGEVTIQASPAAPS